jgi:deoxyribodipyrimidine photo-lyase
VRERIILEGGEEFENAVAVKKTVDSYWKSKDKQYQEPKRKK